MAASNSDILTTAQNSLSKIETALGKKLKTEVDSTKYDSQLSKTQDDLANTALEKLKKQISGGTVTNKTTGKVDNTVTIPSAVYDAFAAPILEKIEGSTITDYSANKNKLLNQLATQIMNALSSISEQTKTVNGIKYTMTRKTPTQPLGL